MVRRFSCCGVSSHLAVRKLACWKLRLSSAWGNGVAVVMLYTSSWQPNLDGAEQLSGSTKSAPAELGVAVRAECSRVLAVPWLPLVEQLMLLGFETWDRTNSKISDVEPWPLKMRTQPLM